MPPAGRSLQNTLAHGTPLGRKYAISENWSQAAVITDDFKYGQWLHSVYYPGRDWRDWGNMLMQRSSDPGEVKNLIKDPAHASTVAQMQGYLAEWGEPGRR